MKKLLALIACISVPGTAAADTWIPYTDGRAGGCWLNSAGHLYGCTAQPQRPSAQPRNRADEMRTERDNSREAALEHENAALRAERDAEYRQHTQADASRRAQRQALYEALAEEERQREIQRSKQREWQWHRERSCNSAEYDEQLRKMGLKRRNSVNGICVKLDWKPGTGDLGQACPPCQIDEEGWRGTRK